MDGRLVEEIKITDQSHKVDCSDYKSGLYLYKLTGDNMALDAGKINIQR
jgi:hypothetical protein